MTNLIPLLLVCLLSLTISFTMASHTGERVSLNASTVEGWTAGNCSRKYIDCDHIAVCHEGLLDGELYFRCVCPEGVGGDGYTNGTGCVTNLTECDMDVDCHQFGFCNLTAGYCYCKEGYVGDGAEVCNDFEDCHLNPCDANAKCVDAQGSFTCTCDFENRYEGDGFTCKHRCDSDTHCHPDAACNSKKRLCECSQGYTGDGVTCTDIDECLDPQACPADSVCVNKLGFYKCKCANGYTNINDKCEALPRDCEELRRENPRRRDGVFLIDPDFTGPANKFWVFCDFRATYAVTMLEIVNKNFDMKAVGQHTFDYGTDHLSLQALINASYFCYQATLLECGSTFRYNEDFMWQDAFGQNHTKWAGSSTDGMCGCGELGKCQRCNCDLGLGKSQDFGYFMDSTQLPVTFIRLGNNSGGLLTLGALKCAARGFDIPMTCSGWMRNSRYASGAYHIDLDGPFGRPPFLVYCDLSTYPYTAVTEVQVQQVNVSMPTQGTEVLTYLQDMVDVLALVSTSAFCIQRVEYVCLNSGITGGRVFVNVTSESRQLTYFPGANGVEDSCGCGATQSCHNRDLRCDCDAEDGIQRRDLGDIIDKNDLPVTAVTGGSPGSENYFLVSHLRCGSYQFGIPPNCEKLRVETAETPLPYTYYIDPDQAPIPGNANNNLQPFLAQCIFNENPDYGITVIHHTSEIAFNISAFFSLTYLQVTWQQLLALETRSTFCVQQVDIDCRQVSLSFSGGSGTWKGLTDVDHLINDALSTCSSSGDCLCDGSGNSRDSGLLTNMSALPITSMNFFSEVLDQLSSNPDALSSITIGPLQCSELFPTCADLENFVRSKKDFGEKLPEAESVVTIDADGAGNITAFEVECRWPDDTVITPSNPEDKVVGVDTEGKSQCFDIVYKDQDGDIITPEQLLALRDRSDNCFQTLSVSCQYARVHGMVNYTTCDGVTQVGWAGSVGQDSCQCGVTRHCQGGPDYECHCDLEDSKWREDGAVIIRKERLPVCQVCMSLDGIPANKSQEIPKRILKYYVSSLNCHAGQGRHVQSSCQVVRMQQKNLREKTTEIVYMHPMNPIPVACLLIPHAPVGQMEVFPEQQVFRNVTGNVTLTFRYFTVNMTILHEIMLKNIYCAQKIYFFCLPTEQPDIVLSGSSAWTDLNGQLQYHWDTLLEEDVDNSGVCKKFPDLCKRCGNPRGYVIYRKSLLPVTSLRVNLPFPFTVVLDSARCSDLYENCYEIMEDGRQRLPGVLHFAIDPDGPGGVGPLKVRCLFKPRDHCAVTLVDAERRYKYGILRKYKKIAFTKKLTYFSNSVKQIQALANISSFCWQPVAFMCVNSKAINKNQPLKSHYSLSGGPSLSFGTGKDMDFVGCPCGITGTCTRNQTCRCDLGSSELLTDDGVITRKEVLPVTEVNYALQRPRTALARMGVGAIRCSNTVCNQFPRDCADAVFRYRRYPDTKRNVRKSGEYFINPTPWKCSEPFLVYCEIIDGNAVAKVVVRTPADVELRPKETSETQYYGPTEDQIRCLIDRSKYCIQPVAYECYQAQLLAGNVFWKGPKGDHMRLWGGGNSGNPGTCACGVNQRCGGQDSHTQQTQRKCNCDANEARWRKDAGVLTIKGQLPVTALDLGDLTYLNDSRVKLTVGNLYCSNKPIKFDECSTGFHDCDEHANCTDQDVGYTCTCRKGWEGKTNNRVTNDDLPVANGRECIDDDECTFNVCPIGISDCVNTPGSFDCICHDGYKKTGPTTCEDIDECARRTHNCDENARCINQMGTFKCQCHKSFRGNGTKGFCHPVGMCVIFGDPHTLSFDQKWVDYMGVPECPTVATTDACPTSHLSSEQTAGTETFRVLFTPWRQDPIRHGMGQFTWVKSLEVHIKTHVIEMLQDRVLIVDGIKTDAFTTTGLVVFRTGRVLVLRSIEGIEIYWDGKEDAEIYVPEIYADRLCGLCGNFNGDQSDDWILGPACPTTGDNTSVPTTDNESKFGNSWMVENNGTCVAQCQKVPPDNECVMNKLEAQRMCHELFDRQTSIFKACIRKLDRAWLKGKERACVYDLCHVHNDVQVVLCSVARKLAEMCQLNTQVDVSDWTDSGICEDPKCEDNRVYRKCDQDLSENDQWITTCQELRAPDAGFTVSLGCVDGCYCPEGYLEEGSDCVMEGDCGCFHNGRYIKVGETLISENCSDSVVCTQGGQVANTSVQCGQHEECSLKDNVVGCHCVDGYILIGDTCQPDPCSHLICSAGAECVEGQCQCLPGYQGDCESCYDIDECATELHYCNDRLQEVCVNTEGSYHCTCKSGFVRVGQVCEDVDECRLGTDNCPPNSQCVNEKGYYGCTCCVGYTFSNGECVWTGVDTQFFNSSAANVTCCDCNTPDCDKPGKVCGSDGVTYANRRALVVLSCLEGRKVHPMYEGSCETNCSQVQCLQPFATCEELPSGLASCGCPSCTTINIHIINMVCASDEKIYRSECEFQAAMCINNIIDIVIVTEPSACNGMGGGGQGITMGNWTDCSAPCGFGESERSVIVHGQEHIVTAVCYSSCPDQTCRDFQCDAERECIETPQGAQCSCPHCGHEVISPVCGMVGRKEDATTFRNLCDLKRAACLQNTDHYLLDEKPCLPDPLDCGVKVSYEIRKNEHGCETPLPHKYTSCSGGCGELPDKCCYKEDYQAEMVKYKCHDGTVYHESVEMVTACKCIPPEQLEALLAA